MLTPRMIVRRCQISTNKKHIRDVFQPKMFAKRLYWAKVSQSKQQELIAVSALGVFLCLLVDPYRKSRWGRPKITWRRTTEKEMTLAHLSWSEAQRWQLEEYCVSIMYPTTWQGTDYDDGKYATLLWGHLPALNLEVVGYIPGSREVQ